MSWPVPGSVADLSIWLLGCAGWPLAAWLWGRALHWRLSYARALRQYELLLAFPDGRAVPAPEPPPEPAPPKSEPAKSEPATSEPHVRGAKTRAARRLEATRAHRRALAADLYARDLWPGQ
jgi:hypothetical protein